MPIPNRQLTKNISLYELLYPSTVKRSEIQKYIEDAWCPEVEWNLIRIAECLQIIRDYFNAPVIPTSGFRPMLWELKQGREGGSQHVLGTAVDFYVKGIPLKVVFAVINGFNVLQSGVINVEVLNKLLPLNESESKFLRDFLKLPVGIELTIPPLFKSGGRAINEKANFIHLDRRSVFSEWTY